MTLQRVVADNRRARRNFAIEDTLETGIVLTGAETRSLRSRGGSLAGAYALVREGQLSLVGAHIPAYPPAADKNYDPDRPRRLLAHRREIARLDGRIRERGWTLIPLSIYFNEDGRAKVALGLGRGLETHDKRAVLKDREWARRRAQVMGRGGRG